MCNDAVNESNRLPSEQLIDMKFITQDSCMGDKWFYSLIAAGKFPIPIKLGRLSRWKAGDYYSWKDKQIKASHVEFKKRQQEAFKRAADKLLKRSMFDGEAT